MDRTTHLVWCVSTVAALSIASVMAQEPKPAPASPQENAIDPISLNAAPAFGDSAPVKKSLADSAASELPQGQPAATVISEWRPKFRVVLITTGSTQGKVESADQLDAPRFFAKDDAMVRTTDRQTGKKAITVPPTSAILMCDDVTVDAKTLESGQLLYAFSCKSKVRLEIDDYTVQGDSVSSKDGQLNITNAVVTSRIATLSAENLQISLSIVGVRMESANAKADDQLGTPYPSKPDSIGVDLFPEAHGEDKRDLFPPSA